jgi:hypothetical protein
VDFCVWDMPGIDIIGLPDILEHFLVVLVTVLETARQDRQEDTEENKWRVQHGYIMSEFADAVSPCTQTQQEVRRDPRAVFVFCYLSKP